MIFNINWVVVRWGKVRCYSLLARSEWHINLPLEMPLERVMNMTFNSV